MGGVSEATPSGVGDPGPYPAAAEALSWLLPEPPPAHPGHPACPAPAQRGTEVTTLWPSPAPSQLTLDHTLDLVTPCNSPSPDIPFLSPDLQPVNLHYLQPN